MDTGASLANLDKFIEARFAAEIAGFGADSLDRQARDRRGAVEISEPKHRNIGG